MRYHALLCTRDEDDIIAESLTHFLTWADTVFVLDSGSVDQTPEILRDFASKDQRVRLIPREPFWFSDQMRGYLFSLIRKDMEDGDWFLRTDTDEFYHVTPPQFVERYLRPGETCAYHQYFDFRLTVPEANALSTSASINAERMKTVSERRRFYIPSLYSEPRMCRYRKNMSWPSSHTFPINAGFVAAKRIPIRHYPNRDPKQMKKRVRLRTKMIEANVNQGKYTVVHHWREENWTSHLIDSKDARLKFWEPGTDLPDVNDTSHLGPSSKRLFQKFYHRFFVRMADRLRGTTTDAFEISLIPEATQQQLAQALMDDA